MSVPTPGPENVGMQRLETGYTNFPSIIWQRSKVISFAFQEGQAAVRPAKGKVGGRDTTAGSPDKK